VQNQNLVLLLHLGNKTLKLGSNLAPETKSLGAWLPGTAKMKPEKILRVAVKAYRKTFRCKHPKEERPSQP
jgi:hypothetical protein